MVGKLLVQENQLVQAQQAIAQLQSPAIEEKAHCKDLDALLRWITTADNAKNSASKNAIQLRRTIREESLRQYQSICQEPQTHTAEAQREESSTKDLFAE